MALFFHANLLHPFGPEIRSDNPRWSMIFCYNAARNNPYKESHHPCYTPLVKVPDAEIRNAGRKRFADSNGDASWLDSSRDSERRGDYKKRIVKGDVCAGLPDVGLNLIRSDTSRCNLFDVQPGTRTTLKVKS